MELTETTPMVGTGLVASDRELAVVAELMEPSERLVADPPLYSPPASAFVLLVVSPPEPADDPDDE
jgi:hypothetical protein